MTGINDAHVLACNIFKMTKAQITREEIIRLFGQIDDQKIVEILAHEPTGEQLEEVSMWLAEQSAVMGELRKPLTGTAGDIYNIIVKDTEFPENRD